MLNDLVEDFFDEALERPFSKMHDDVNGESYGIPTVDLKVQFKTPGRIGDVLSKKLWVNQLKSSSLLCGFQFTNQDDKIVLEGEVTLVNVKIQKENNSIKSESFSDEMKSKISNYQQS